MAKPFLMSNSANRAISSIPLIEGKRSLFPVQYSRKQTMKASYLYPIFFQETMPGDTWDIQMTHFTRLLPQVTAPIDNLWARFYFFYDPNRLLWDNFTKQHGERKNPDDSIDYLTPAIEFENGIPFKSLWDYLGGTRCAVPNTKMTAFGSRMYNHIWNEYFRASMIQDSIPFNTSDSDEDPNDYELKKVCKMHDYFTDSLPSILAGGLNQITLPLGTEAPVIGNGNNITLQPFGWPMSEGRNLAVGPFTATQDVQPYINEVTTGWAGIKLSEDGTKSGLKADLSNAVSSTITAMRMAIDTMELLENDNKSGARYTELMYSRYKTLLPDLMLYRPQLIGSMATPLFTTPVVQTSGTGTTGQATPQGNIAGYGTCGESGNVIRVSCGEFGHIMGLMVIQAIPQYQQGMDKKYQRWERYDYFYPEFQCMTDQAITNGEIYYQDPEEVDETTGEEINKQILGYTGRYDEYRTFKNEICGELRSEYPLTMDSWHYAEKFEELPVLNGEFLEDKTDEILMRTMAIQKETENNEEVVAEQFITDIEFRGTVVRGMPATAKPRTGGNIFG